MNYRRKTLFPRHEGSVHLPVFIRETSDEDRESVYVVWVRTSKLHKDGVNSELFGIRRLDMSRLKRGNLTKRKAVLNEISNLALKEFVFVDDGSFYLDRLDLGSMPLNLRNAQRLVGKQLFNLSNIYAPLRVYRLKRVIEKTCSEKPTSGNITRTFWDMEVLDHTKEVPCARSGHSVLVDLKNNRLFLIGGVTILADQYYQGNIDDIDNNWLYFPLNDIWSMDLNTGKWYRLMDLSFEMGKALSIIPKFLSEGFKFPDLYVNVSLAYDYKNDLIYGSYSPLECSEVTKQRKTTSLFSIDLSTQCVRDECLYDITEPASLQIAYEHSKLVVHFPSLLQAHVCVIPYTKWDLLKCVILSRKLLPRNVFGTFASSVPLRFIGDNLFCFCSEIAQNSQDKSRENLNIRCLYHLPTEDKLRNLLK